MNSIETPNPNERSEDNREEASASSPEENLSFVLVENEAKAEEEDKSLVERYFGEQQEEGGLDRRVVDYFRNYLGPEATMFRLNNMHPDTRNTLISAIQSGDIGEVVELMESHVDNWVNNLGTILKSIDSTPYMPGSSDSGKVSEARSKLSDERFRIRKILERLNQSKK